MIFDFVISVLVTPSVYTEGPVHEISDLLETSKSGPQSARQRNAICLAFRWRTDGGRHCVLARFFARLRRTWIGAPTQSMETDVASDEKLVLYDKWTAAQAHT